jgi:hypothetical protein
MSLSLFFFCFSSCLKEKVERIMIKSNNVMYLFVFLTAFLAPVVSSCILFQWHLLLFVFIQLKLIPATFIFFVCLHCWGLSWYTL